MNASYDDELNNDDDAPKMPYYVENMNAYSNNEENNYKVARNHLKMMKYTPKNGGNNETIDNDGDKHNKKEIEKEPYNEKLNTKDNDKETEVNYPNEEDKEHDGNENENENETELEDSEEVSSAKAKD